LTPCDRVANYLRATTDCFDIADGLSNAEAVMEKIKSGNFTAFAVGAVEFRRQLERVKGLRSEKEEKRCIRRASWRMLITNPGDKVYWEASARGNSSRVSSRSPIRMDRCMPHTTAAKDYL
jgi:hypothetical protein